MEGFNKRLSFIFEKFSLNASTFADKIGVQRSSMSHILSGRNKPSLDFILKTYEAFPQINLNWLAIGEGPFLKADIASISNSKNDFEFNKEINNDQNEISNLELDIEKKHESKNTFQKSTSDFIQQIDNEVPLSPLRNESEIEQILFFYKDGTFKSFRPK